MQSQSTPDGGSYLGEMKNGKKSGKGVFKLSGGDMYLGDWENDVFHG